MKDFLLHQMHQDLKAEVAALTDRIRDLERHAAQSAKLQPYKEEDSPVTKRSPISQAAGAGSDYYNGRPRQ